MGSSIRLFTMLPDKVLNISSATIFDVLKQQSHPVACLGSQWLPPIRQVDVQAGTDIIFS